MAWIDAYLEIIRSIEDRARAQADLASGRARSAASRPALSNYLHGQRGGTTAQIDGPVPRHIVKQSDNQARSDASKRT